MNDFIDGIMARPASHRNGGWALTIILLLFVYWQYFYSGQSKELTSLNEQIEELETKITHERRLARNLDKIKEEVKVLDVKLKEAMAQLPDAREIPELLASISDLARDAGLQVGLFKPRADNFKEFYVEVPVAVSVEGTFHQVATFFDEVAQLDRIVNISGIGLKDPRVSERDPVRVKADCLATTFRFLDEEERSKRSATKKGKGRRRR